MRDINLIYAFKLLKSLYFFSGVLIPFFTDWGGITFFQVMFLQSWFVFWTTLLEVPTGAIADRYGHKVSIALGVLVNIVAVLTYVSMKNFYVFLLAEFLWAVSAALISGADVALIYEKLKEEGKEKESKKVLGRYSSFELIGIAIAAPVGSFIAARYGLQYSTLAMALPLILALVVMLCVKKEKKIEKEERNYLEVFRSGFAYFWKNEKLRALGFDSVLISIFAFIAIWTYQPQLKSAGFALSLFGVVHSLGSLAEIIVLNNFNWLEERFTPKGYLLFSGLIVAFSYFALAFAGLFSPIFIILIFGFGLTRKVLLTHYINKHIEAKERATVLSTVSMLNSFGSAIMNLIIGAAVTYSLALTHIALGILVIASLAGSKVTKEMLE